MVASLDETIKIGVNDDSRFLLASLAAMNAGDPKRVCVFALVPENNLAAK
jgi:hypothetical protein